MIYHTDCRTGKSEWRQESDSFKKSHQVSLERQLAEAQAKDEAKAAVLEHAKDNEALASLCKLLGIV